MNPRNIAVSLLLAALLWATQASALRQPIRVAADEMSSRLVVYVAPRYPDEARDARIEGVVLLDALIDTAGNVSELRVITGHPLFRDPALRAVEQWVYAPYDFEGETVDVVTTSVVEFRLE
jgi:protein TonB